MKETYFTSDTHFGHANIIKYSNRPYSSVEEMDEALVENWNSVVKPDDTIYHLGDGAYWRRYDPTPVFKRLNGTIHWIRGNHDFDLFNWPLVAERVTSINSYLEITVGKQEIVLCHYAFRVWNKSHFGTWNLYGHSHGSLPDDPELLSMDVGVDPCGYRPISFDEVKEHMSRKHFVPIDHHGK